MNDTLEQQARNLTLLFSTVGRCLFNEEECERKLLEGLRAAEERGRQAGYDIGYDEGVTGGNQGLI